MFNYKNHYKFSPFKRECIWVKYLTFIETLKLKNIFPGKLSWLISCKSLEVFEIEKKKSALRDSLLPVGGQFNYSDQK